MPAIVRAQTFNSLNAGSTALAGGAFTPLNLPNLLAWYQAANSSGVNITCYNDAGTTLCTNTQTIQQWNDSSGNGFNLTEATAGKRPQWLSGGFNSKPTVQLAQANATVLRNSAFGMGNGTASSFFAVCQMLTGTSNNGRLISYAAPGQNDDGAGSAAVIARDATGNAFSMQNFFSGDHGQQNVSLATNMRIGEITDATNVTPYLNAVAGTPASWWPNNVNNPHWTTGGELAIGGFDNFSAYWDGPCSEIVITTSTLGTTDISNLDNYFKTKWGL